MCERRIIPAMLVAIVILHSGGIGHCEALAQAVIERDERIAGDFKLTSVFPNPARDQVTVTAKTPAGASVRVAVYDMLGRRIAQVEAANDDGTCEVTIPLTGHPAGVYVLRLSSGVFSESRPLIVVR